MLGEARAMLGHADPDAAVTDALNQGQAFAKQYVAFASFQENIGSLAGQRDPDDAGSAFDAQSARLAQAEWLVFGETDFTGTDVDSHGALPYSLCEKA